MFWQDLDPGYYQNPSAYTYLVYALLRVMYGPLGFALRPPVRERHRPVRQEPDRDLDRGPHARRGAVHGAAWRPPTGPRGGSGESARGWWPPRVLAFAFLPVAYSRVAVTDVGALIGVALSLGFAGARLRARARPVVRAWPAARRGSRVSFKYTAGLALAAARDRRARARCASTAARALGGLALGGGARRRVVFVALNPYLFSSFDAWWSDLRDQAEVARDQPKPGQESGGVSYYLDSLTWGLGWAAAIAALVGAALELRRSLVRGLMLDRGAAGAVRLPERPVPLLRPLAAARLPGAGDAGGRGDRPGGGRCSRDSWRRSPACGRTLARPPAGSPSLRARPAARRRRAAARRCSAATTRASRRATGSRRTTRRSCGPRSSRPCPGAGSARTPRARRPRWLTPLRAPRRAGPSRAGRTRPPAASASARSTSPGLVARPDGGVRASAYHEVLDPGVIDDYRLYGYCLVVTVDTVRDRALQTGDRGRARLLRPAGARVDGRARPSARTTRAPTPVPFNFDLSFNYYPPEYHRPGPTVQICRLDDCRQAIGPPIIRIPRAREPAPFGDLAG